MLALPQIRRGTQPDDAAGAPPISFDSIFRSYARLVGRWAQRLGGPGIDTDEVVQEVFVTVSRRLAGFRGDEKLAGWLFQITARVVANQRRAMRRRWFRWVSLSRQIEDRAGSRVPGPAEILEAREGAARFYRVLDRLRENHRDVLVLFELEQMSTDEISALINRPPATVRVWLHRARAAFIKAWESQVDLPEEDDVSEGEGP
jgi:RNA polymerase sigma-70 factor, ECF subfamily